MRRKSLTFALILALLSTGLSAAHAATPDCLFGGQVRNISGQKSSCWMVNGSPVWFSFKKRAEDKLTAYEKTKLKAYKEIKNAAAGKSIKNIELKYVISKHLPAQLRTEYIRQTEQASRLYDQFFTRPVFVNNYFQTEKDAAFIKTHPVLKRDFNSFTRWFESWPKGKETEHTVGLAAWFFKSGGKSEGHTGVLTASNGSIAKLRLYSHQVVAHEYFHVVQDFYKQSQDEIGYEGVSGYDIYYPPIFREGSANTIATAISMDSFEDYLLFYQIFLSQKKDQYAPKIFTRINGKRIATPMFLVMIAIASTDLLFALDSIPATFGVTQEPFLVFAANAFALLGLRALYFLLKGLLDKLVYLSLGLSIILMFIGVKLIMTYVHEIWYEVPKIPTLVSLAVIATILIVSTVASLVKSKRDPSAVAHAGRITGSDHEK